MNKIVKIAWMYPDLLNLHGERGNAAAFEMMSEKLKIKLEIYRIDDLEKEINFDDYDILLFNAGELKVIENISEKLKDSLTSLKKYINNKKIIFVTGTTGALFAKEIYRKDGSQFDGLGLLDMSVKERKMVLGDDLFYKANNMEIMSSQIQMIDITLNKAKPFGKVKYGYGNIGKEDEGARYKNLIFTNSLGPVLVKNPWLTEYLITLACKNKKINIKVKPKNDLEKKSLKSCKEFIKLKEK